MKSFSLRVGAIATLLAGFLVACPSTPPAPVVSTVTVSGAPTDNNLKMNVPVTLTATASDASGTTITGATFTWVSSNPDAVSVDAAGMVTAKRFGTAIITASSGGVSGATVSQTTYGLEAAFGTWVARTNSGSARVYRFRPKAGQTIAASTKFDLVVNGPPTWNNNQPQTLIYTVGANPIPLFTFNATSAITAVSGTYKMTTTYSGETFESTPNVIDANSKLGTTTITLSNVTSSSATASWTPVTDAVSYYSFVYNALDGSGGKFMTASSATSSTITGFTLDKTKNPEFGVAALNYDENQIATIKLPNQVLRSWTYAPLVLP